MTTTRAILLRSLLSCICTFAATTALHAGIERQVDVDIHQENCTFTVQSNKPFGELYVNYWTTDFKKMNEVSEADIKESSFTSDLRLSFLYMIFTADFGGEIAFFDAPPTAKSIDDVVKLVLPETFRSDLNSCLEALPCPCDIGELSTSSIDKVLLSSSTDVNQDSSCLITVEYNDKINKEIRLQRSVEDSQIFYSCNSKEGGSTSSEWKYRQKPLHQHCVEEITEFVSANKQFLAKRSEDKTFCPNQ